MIYCCNCAHCKTVKGSRDENGYRVLCRANRWKNNRVNFLKTVYMKRRDDCPVYDSMGEDDLDDFRKMMSHNYYEQKKRDKLELDKTMGL